MFWVPCSRSKLRELSGDTISRSSDPYIMVLCCKTNPKNPTPLGLLINVTSVGLLMLSGLGGWGLGRGALRLKSSGSFGG